MSGFVNVVNHSLSFSSRDWKVVLCVFGPFVVCAYRILCYAWRISWFSCSKTHAEKPIYHQFHIGALYQCIGPHAEGKFRYTNGDRLKKNYTTFIRIICSLNWCDACRCMHGNARRKSADGLLLHTAHGCRFAYPWYYGEWKVIVTFNHKSNHRLIEQFRRMFRTSCFSWFLPFNHSHFFIIFHHIFCFNFVNT